MSREARPEPLAVAALRPPKPAVDSWRPLDALLESERRHDGRVETVAALFLAGRECPFTCVFCDLWRFTIDGPTPPGSLPRQISSGLASLGEKGRAAQTVKLYNASNFFDPLAVPDEDLDAIVDAVGDVRRVVVESHPRLLGERSRRLARRLPGELEVAMGLETAHPEVLPRLGKSMTLEDYRSAAARLATDGIALRSFVLLGVPFLEAEAQVEWCVRSAREAFRMGARHVSLIPVRGGNGAMEELAGKGDWTPPRLEWLEEAFEVLLAEDEGVVTVDTWDLEQLSGCSACAGTRRDRLTAMNLSGRATERPTCAECEPS